MNFLKKLKVAIFGESYIITVSFLMKSGVVVDVLCDDIKIKTQNNELMSYEFTGNRNGDALYIRLDDISAIKYVKN